ncbi:MAG: hypothetical protein ACLQG3_01495 [Terracidiphilus sp.]
MIQATPPSDFDWTTLNISIASLVVAVVSFIASLASAAIANGARKDAERIAARAHDEWAQQKWFDLYFSTNSAYDAMEKLQADCIVQTNRLISIAGGSYPDRANEVVRLFREIQAMAMVFPKCTAIDMLCAATSGFVDDQKEMLSKQRLKNLMGAMNEIREKALVDSSVLKRVIK